jgi:hypothetical protein
MQGDAGHPGYQEKSNMKKWRAKEEKRHKGLLTQKTTVVIVKVTVLLIC